ncbi:putative ABC transporter ATP-binding protein [Nocardiopsis sp. JB363]|nr:putative ABC transporter ATP-binding protein [Nocardiopsis sp. JB363]
MIEADSLTRTYGDTTVVDHLDFTVRPGRVTGFLGANGAGKTTTMRMLLGLEEPTSGHARIDGLAYRDLPDPLRTVGALLDPQAPRPGRSARDHLRWLCRAGRIPLSRADDLIDQVGLGEVAARRVGSFSLGMRQRLGIAAMLLGDPSVLVLDEPLNGLDPEGIAWVRALLRDLAAQGRTVFVSSHLMGEMEATADHVLVLRRGRLIADLSAEELSRGSGAARVRVVSPQVDRLAHLVAGHAAVRRGGADAVEVVGLDAPALGALAAREGVELHELTPLRTGLEEAFLALNSEGEITREGIDHA